MKRAIALPDHWTRHPVVLEGMWVRLEPLSLDHLAGLCHVGLNEEIWRWTNSLVRTEGEMKAYIESALQDRSQRRAYPFTTVACSSGEVLGTTRFGNIDSGNRRVEIGWTWIAQSWWRTPVNTEAKYLMLRHAFEELHCLRVEFKADVRNERSRAALVRIGAREEGILRSHMITQSGRVRDTAYYSVIASEWPDVRSHLERQLRRPFKPTKAAPTG